MLASADLVAFAGSADLERSAAFYRDVLGLALVEVTPFAAVLDAHGTQLRVTLVPEPAAAPYTVLGWSVPDISAAIGALTARGVAFTRYPGMEQDADGVWDAPGGARIAWFTDPDGNVLSLQQGV